MMPSPRTSSSPAIDHHAVVGDQPRAAVDQTQRQIRLAAAGRAEQNHAGAREIDAAGVQQRAHSLANLALGRIAISDRP
jgi:hypothetical protein